MSREATGKSVLISGCSVGGIGDALARTFHRRGCRVFATARDLAKLQHLKEMGITVLPLDVLEANSLKQAAETVRVATGGTLDILVNNSGIGTLSGYLGSWLKSRLCLSFSTQVYQCRFWTSTLLKPGMSSTQM